MVAELPQCLCAPAERTGVELLGEDDLVVIDTDVDVIALTDVERPPDLRRENDPAEVINLPAHTGSPHIFPLLNGVEPDYRPG